MKIDFSALIFQCCFLTKPFLRKIHTNVICWCKEESSSALLHIKDEASYNWVRWSAEFAVIICHSMWTIIFGRLGGLDLLWVDMAGPFREHSLQVAFGCVTSELWLFTTQLPLWWFSRRVRTSPDPRQNDKACIRLDRLMRLLRVWKSGSQIIDIVYFLFLARFLHLIIGL